MYSDFYVADCVRVELLCIQLLYGFFEFITNFELKIVKVHKFFLNRQFKPPNLLNKAVFGDFDNEALFFFSSNLKIHFFLRFLLFL